MLQDSPLFELDLLPPSTITDSLSHVLLPVSACHSNVLRFVGHAKRTCPKQALLAAEGPAFDPPFSSVLFPGVGDYGLNIARPLLSMFFFFFFGGGGGCQRSRPHPLAKKREIVFATLCRNGGASCGTSTLSRKLASKTLGFRFMPRGVTRLEMGGWGTAGGSTPLVCRLDWLATDDAKQT